MKRHPLGRLGRGREAASRATVLLPGLCLLGRLVWLSVVPRATALPPFATCCGTALFVKSAAGPVGLRCLTGETVRAPGDIVTNVETARLVGRLAPAALETLEVPIDVNSASAEALERLPGIGPSLARKIVESRHAEGPFADAHALERIAGIGPAIAGRIDRFLAARQSRRAVVCKGR